MAMLFSKTSNAYNKNSNAYNKDSIFMAKIVKIYRELSNASSNACNNANRNLQLFY